MVVCFYADLYWILNFIMNLFLLYITAYLRHETVSRKRLVISSAFFAILSVVITYISNCVSWMPEGIMAVAEISLIVWCAYGPKSLRQFFLDFITFLSLSALTAGMLFMLKELFFGRNFGWGITKSTDFSLIFLVTSIVMLFLLFKYLRFSILEQNLKRRSIVNATLIHHGKKREIKALYDTGNHLISPYTGEPVVIISRELSDCLDVENNANPLIIPYHSIGGDGILKAYRLDIMRLQDGSIRENFLAAVSDDICTEKEIQMILNN